MRLSRDVPVRDHHPKGEKRMTISKLKARRILILFTLVAVTASVYVFFQNKSFASGFFGAIYTTTFNGQAVNENTYANKDAVYLNGGPQNEDIQGLPDGTYYFQVTNPSGSVLLSTDPAVCRQLLVANGRVAAADGPACQHTTGIPNSANGSTPVQLAPFNDTPNNGAEYKVWLIRQAGTTVAADGMHLNFSNNNAKTDNFKVVVAPCTNCNPTSVLSGKKYYDANGSTLFDTGEVPVAGIKIVITLTTSEGTSTTVVATDEAGNWSYVVPTGAIYQVGEFLPDTAPDDPGFWAQTAPVADSDGFQGYGGTANGDQLNLDFGDICFRVGGASQTPCSVSYEPPPSPTPTPEPTPTPTPCADCPTITLSGTKFYDANANGVYNDGEVTLQGVRIAVLLTVGGETTTTVVTTNADGNWSLVVPVGAQYIVGEYIPDTDAEQEPGSFWEQTAPAANDEGFRGYSGTTSEDLSGLNFGDNCFHPDGDGNPVASPTPCTVSYPAPPPTPTPTPSPTPDNQ